MERKFVTNSFVGFPHVVTPIQNIFNKECEANLSTDVLLFFSELQKKLIGEMMRGACALTLHRKSDTVTAEDLLCHLDAQWKIDPLLISGKGYRVEETTEEVDHSLAIIPLSKRRKKKGCINSEKTISEAPKLSARKLKEMEERENERRTLEICRCIVFKLPLPPVMKKKSETEAYTELMCRPDITEFFGKQIKQYSFYRTPPAIAPTYKSNSKIEKKSSLKENTRKVASSKERLHLEFKIHQPNPDSHTTKMCGVKQDTSDTVAELTPETSACKPKLKVDEKLSSSDISIENFSLREKTRYETKIAKQSLSKIPTYKDKLLVRSPTTKGKQVISGRDTVLKLCPKAPICKLKSENEEKKSTSEYFTKKYLDKKTMKHDFEVENCTTAGTSGIERPQPSIEISPVDLQVTTRSGKRCKRKGFNINAVPGETAKAGRKKLAKVLLKIAGKY